MNQRLKNIFTMEVLHKEEKLLAWSWPPEDITLVRSHDCFLYDENDKKYIDFIMGWCVGNFGWGNEEITRAIHEFSGPSYVYSTFKYKPWFELAELLTGLSPGLEKCFRNTGGTDSVEAAMKIAMVYTGRGEFISVEDSYHGNSLGALSLGTGNRNTYPALPTGFHKIKRPLHEQALEQLEEFLKTEKIAAFILEPISTHPHIEVPSKKFMEEVQRLCKQYGTLLVFDEVGVGFGRTGKTFACEHFNAQPDILCVAKALSGGHAGIGATLTTKAVGDKVEGKVSGSPTYGWHPVSVAASVAALRYYTGNKESILANVERLSSIFKRRFGTMDFKEDVKLNIMGLAISLDVGESSYAEKIQRKCLKEGLLIETQGSHLMMFPSLTMDAEVAVRGLDILDGCV
jgi:adenosylmethionine-8-amino-7-oxononanoate aminotransferase